MILVVQPAVFWDENPSGKLTELGGIKCYLAQPERQTGKGIVLFPDAGGMHLCTSEPYICIYKHKSKIRHTSAVMES